MGKIKGLLDEELPREKLINFGADNLTNVELLAIILRVGSKNQNVLELSREILTKFDISMISRKTYENLLEFRGISKAKATQIVSVFELSRRLMIHKNEKREILNSSEDVYNFSKIYFKDLEIEKVMLILVDSKNNLIKSEFIFSGSINYSIIDIRLIIEKCLLYKASGFFLVHNHPSGDSTPSFEDIEITKKIKEVTNKLNLRFLDHLIIGDDYLSLHDNDYFD